MKIESLTVRQMRRRHRKAERTAFVVGYECAHRKPLVISWVRWHLERRPLAEWERQLLGLPVPLIQRWKR